MKCLEDHDCGYGTLQCECGEIFDVDVCTEENLKLIEGVLYAECPKCKKIEMGEIS